MKSFLFETLQCLIVKHLNSFVELFSRIGHKKSISFHFNWNSDNFPQKKPKQFYSTTKSINLFFLHLLQNQLRTLVNVNRLIENWIYIGGVSWSK